MDIFCGLLETAEPSREYHDENRMTSRPQTPTEGAEAQSTVPLCRNCKDPLVSGSDTYKKDGKFLMNCKACRDATAKRRKRNYAKNCQFSIVRGRNKKRKVNSPPSKDPTPPPPADPECTICADTFPAMDLISLSECTHEPDVCHECFLSWLTQQMESTAWDRIACPSTNCTKTLSHDDIKATAPADIFARFDDLSTRAFLSADTQFRYCLSPTCSSGQVHDNSNDGNVFRCVTCSFLVCTTHNIAFHEGETCATYDERLRREEQEVEDGKRVREQQEVQSAAEVKRCATVCPGCQVPIQKRSGCDHMTCRKCGFEFCYVCRAPYRGTAGIHTVGNLAHMKSCRYHTSRLPTY